MTRQPVYDPTAYWKFLEYHDVTWVRLSDVMPYFGDGLLKSATRRAVARKPRPKLPKRRLQEKTK